MSKHHVAKLTAISVEKARPRDQRYAIPDSGCRGLYLNVYPTGRKSFSVRYRFDGASKNLTLDGFPPLAEARKAATAALAEVVQGRDPAAAKFAAKAEVAEREMDTVERLSTQFIEQHAKRKTRRNTWRATIGTFNNHVLPAWGSRTVHDIKRRDVIELLEQIAVDRPITANRVRAVLSKFFGWLCERDVIAASPCVGVKAPSAEVARARVLNDAELKKLWAAAEAIGGPTGAYVKLLILTGQRRSEIAGLKWSEIDGDMLVLAASRMKGKKAHILSLSTQARAVIDGIPKLMPQVPRSDDCVLGRKLGWHFHHVKRDLDTHMGDTPKWVIHDIRRSVASGLARLGVAIPTIERIMAHSKGMLGGVTGTYVRHSFLPEMALAMQKWADHVERIVTGKVATVVKLQRR
jgi:integrase